MGATKRPFYRLVVADARSPRDGRFIEAIGYYDPLPTPAKVEIDADKVREWMRKGARPSDSARDLLQAQGILPARPRPAGEVNTPKGGTAAAANGTHKPATAAVADSADAAASADADDVVATDVELEAAVESANQAPAASEPAGAEA